MAAPIHVGTGTVVAGTSVSASWPSGHAVGDLGFLTIAKNVNGTVSTPSGWTLLHNDSASNTTGSVRGQVFYKFAASTSESDVALTDANNIIGCITAYRNVDPTTPVGTPTDNSGTNGTSLTIPAVTTTLSDSLIFVFAGSERDVAGAHFSSVTNANLTGITIHANDGTTTGNGSGLMVASGVKATAGSTGSTTVVNTASSGRVVMQVVVNPAPTSGISGTTSGALSATGTLVGTGALVGTSAGALTATGSLTSLGQLVGTSTAVLSTNTTLTGVGQLAGSSASVLTVTGTGVALSPSNLAAQVTMELSASGTLTATGTMSAAEGTVLTATGTLTAIGALAGSSAGTLVASGTLTQLNNMVGSSSSVLTATGTLTSTYSLGGYSSSTLSASGTLTAVGRLAGISTSVLTVTASGNRSGLMAGSSSSVLTAVGTLRALPSPAISLNFRNKWLAVYNARQALLNKISGIAKITMDSQSTLISTLTNRLDHPSTGLSALSTAQSVLSSRVTVTEGQISVQSADITSLSAVVDGKASVGITNALTARIDTLDSPYSYNLLNNPGLATDMRNWGTVFWNQASDPAWIVERNLLGVGYQVAGFNNFGFRHPGTPATGVNFVAGADTLPAVAGYDYIISGKIAATGMAVCELRVYFLNEAMDTLLAEVPTTPNATGYVGGTSEANWQATYVKTTAPVGTKWMRLGLRALTAGTATPRAQVMKAMIERAAPGQTVPSAWNVGRLAAWAEWDLQFNVNGYISGIKLSSDGKTSDFVINADTFKVLKPGGGAGLSWNNGIIWTQGSTYSVMMGQDMTPTGDVIFWVGPNPASPQLATKADASIYFTETGDAVFRGVVNQSLLSGSALELGSTRIHTGGGRLAPFTIRDFAYKGNPASPATMTLTSTGYVNPDAGEGYNHMRFSRYKADVILECQMHGDGNDSTENIYLEVQYDGGSWAGIHSFTGINCDRRAGFSMIFRYTTLESWTSVNFRARTSNGRAMSLLFKVTVDNTNESGNAPGSYSGADASGGGGGSPPPPGGGGGGGGYCVDYDSMLPDGRYLRNVAPGDLIECVDVRTGELSMQPLLHMSVGVEQCYRVTTEHGEVVQSKSTPMNMRDGSVVRTPDLAGLELLTHDHGFEICSITLVGDRAVLKPDLGDRMFFAGVRSDSTIATHNIRDKDIEP